MAEVRLAGDEEWRLVPKSVRPMSAIVRITAARELTKGTEMTEPISHGPKPPTVAGLGLGTMGTPIAHNLVASGFPVVVWNRRHDPVVAFVDAGATAAPLPAGAAAAADIVVTMLADGKATADVFGGPSGVLAGVRRDTIWIQMAPSASTGPSSSHTSPQTTTSTSSTPRSQAATVLHAPAS